MKVHVLKYKFHVITINFTEADVEDRTETFEEFEELLKCYRRLKNTKAYGIVPCCTDIHYYTAELQEQSTEMLDDLL